MSPMRDNAYGRECGLIALREVVEPGSVSASDRLSHRGKTTTNQNCRLRVVSLDSMELMED